MSEFVILGDLHLGARNASPVLCDYQLKYFEDELFPYMEKHKISTILQLGDLFDSRKFSNHIILKQWKDRFFDVLESKGYTLVTLLGNHDLATKNSLSINTPELFLSDYSNITIVNSPKEYAFFGVNFLLVPWVCLENQVQVKEIIDNSDSLFCAGHFEFDGFEMQKGVAAHGGVAPKEYDKFDLVLSGHYHTRSKKYNILYTGVPYEMTWADFNDQKGFHVFNTKTHKISFVKTKKTLFQRVEYNDKVSVPSIPSNVIGTYIKVVVINKTNPYEFEKFINGIMLQMPADLKITDIEVDFDDIDVEDELELDDTKTLIGKFIEQVETDLDKDKLKDIMQSLYLSALEVTD